MIEPKPLTVPASELSENSQISVGVVLTEDKLSALTIETATSPIRVNRHLTLKPHTSYTIEGNDSEMRLRDPSGRTLLETDSLSLSSTTATFPEPSLTITPIVAGRSFHWKKEIPAKFPGDFEISSEKGMLQIVNTIPFEHYIACVVVSEMSSGTPTEFIKAQTVVARSWAKCFLNEKHPNKPYELCNDDDCQRYHGVTFADQHSLQTSLETSGEYLVSDKENVVAAYYSKSCGGITENPKDCFGFEAEGISSVVDGTLQADASDIETWMSHTHHLENPTAPHLYCGGSKAQLEKLLGGVDDIGEYFRWKHVEKKTDLAKYLTLHTAIDDATQVTTLEPIKRGASGRIHELAVMYETTEGTTKKYVAKSQYEIRLILHPSFLYSSAITITDTEDTFTFHGAGWGHGVGLCQIGATFQAIEGKNYQEILNLYFPQSHLFSLPDNLPR